MLRKHYEKLAKAKKIANSTGPAEKATAPSSEDIA
jgi:hypothetical protein